MCREENILLVLFYHVNVMVTYPFNENKPVLGATLQNWGSCKTVGNFFGRLLAWARSKLIAYKKRLPCLSKKTEF